ncbi:MAG: 3-hydroxyacyl-CoA dehydrogenase, partial [Anaerolineae bacterium]|nr:3-hydroxyacyl-CoA dehydrogenase [Anaerolineae bacterium]
MTGVVEVVRTPTTEQAVLDRAVTLVRRMDKTPLLTPDTPGLVVNRIAQAFYGEALSLLDNGGVDAATIDKLMEAAGFARGPFREIDYRGVDRVLAVAQAMYEATFHAAHYRPHSRLDRMHQAGLTGDDSPRGGFYPKKPNA